MKASPVSLLLGVLLSGLTVTQHALGLEVIEGEESVVLPCEAPPGAATSVVWNRDDLNPPNVHVHRKTDQAEEDVNTTQHQLFTDRTEVQPDALRTGHISLTLKHIQLCDGGSYNCTARGGGEKLTDKLVQLKVISKEEAALRQQATRLLIILIAVGILSVPIILCFVAAVLRWLYRSGYIWQKVPQVEVEVDSGVKSVVLPCEATGQLPEDVRVQWTDVDMIVHVSLKDSDQHGEQDGLYRGRTEMKRQRPGDFSLTLKHPTVRDSKIYTCTVYSREGHVLMEKEVELKVKEHRVEVEEGEKSVRLPFKTTELPEDVKLRWRRLKPMKTIHGFQYCSDQQDQQDPSYRGRTEMRRDLEPGDVTLILKDPTETDTGRYSCRVYSMERDIRRETTVFLSVTGRPLKKKE